MSSTTDSAEPAPWDAVAAAWRAWWPLFERAARGLSERLVELAGVAPGQRVLDVASGAGEPALTAAVAVGPCGRVVATDASAGMLAVARERARAAGLANVEFLARDAQSLGLPGASFDAALCRWGLMLVPRPAVAAAQVRTALRPGARFALAVWATADQVPFMRVARAVIERELSLPPADPAEPGPLRLGDPDELTAILVEAGFEAVAVERQDVTMDFATAADYARFVSEVSGCASRTLGALPAGERARVLAAIERAARPFARADGRVVFENRSLCAVARRP